MKRLGDELLKKCRGLPLVVIVLGGLLAVNEWETVYRNINLHWIVEGFVSLDAYDEYREITVEDIAYQYLMELVNRGMVQARFKLSGKIKTCHLHDLMRDLCISKATQESFLSIRNIQLDNEMEDCSSSIATCKTRRLSLNVRGSAKGNSCPRVEQIGRTMLHLQTLLLFCFGASVGGMWEQFRLIYINNKFLRVLKLINVSGSLPKAVGDLVHLRYLSLVGSEFEGLPQSMGNLLCMEFLDLCVRQRVTMPNVLWKMRRLRYLCLPYQFAVEKKFSVDQKKLRLDTLKSLHTLRNFCLNNCDVNDVAKLINLQKLTLAAIYYADDKLEIIPQLAKFELIHLQSSSFIFLCYGRSFLFEERIFMEGELSKTSSYPHSCKMSICGKIEKLPEHKNLPQQLRKLVLFESELEEDPMPILERLHHLVVLLISYAFEGKEMVCSAGGFPQLKHLVLDHLPNLEEWRVAEGAMPHLSRLGISQCPKLKAVPEGVHVYDGQEASYRERLKFLRRF